MKSCTRPRSRFVLLLAVCLPVCSPAQNGVEKGWSDFYRGEYDAAVRHFSQAAASVPERIEAIIGQSLALQELGHYEEARNLLGAEHEKHADARLIHRLGELELFLGNEAAAFDDFAYALRLSPSFRPAQLEHAILRWHRGQRDAARKTFASFLDFYRIGASLQAEEIALAARACIYLERYNDANRLFDEAVHMAPHKWPLYIPWGNLFLEKYNDAEAKTIFADALKQNPSCVPAMLGLGRSLASSDFGEAVATVEHALALNSQSPEAHATLAELYLAANSEKQAAEQLALVSKDYPDYVPALALQAVLSDRSGKTLEVEHLIGKIARIHPKDATAFIRLGEDNARRYLFRESVGHYRRGLEVDSENWSAAAGLGTSLSRLGHEAEAKEHLDAAFKHDPFNVLAGNLLRLFDEMASYDTVRTAHFLIRLHHEDADVIGPVAADLCEAAYREMAPRYGVTPANPITVEIFPQHDDFAVRCFGIPGAQVFLGICFGPLLAMDSPRARDKASFNWQETLWHEIAHVIHLELTDNRAPRWFAEGLAVYETAKTRSEWSMNMELGMIRALRSGDLLPLRDLDEAFARRPEMISLVYYQASQIVEYIATHYGFEKVLALLTQFKQGKKTNEAVSAAFGTSVDEFDQKCQDFLRQKFQPQKVKVEWSGPVKSDKLTNHSGNSAQQAQELKELAEKEPDNFFAAVLYGKHLAVAGSTSEAESHLRRAQKLLPAYVEENNPYAILADIYWKQGRRAEAVAQLQQVVSHNGEAWKEASQLGEWQLALEDTASAAEAFSAATAIYPYDAALQRRLGELALATHRVDSAVQAFQTLLALHPSDRAGAHCLLAQAYLVSGRRALAKQQALKALEIAPDFEAAQEILLQTVE